MADGSVEDLSLLGAVGGLLQDPTANVPDPPLTSDATVTPSYPTMNITQASVDAKATQTLKRPPLVRSAPVSPPPDPFAAFSQLKAPAKGKAAQAQFDMLQLRVLLEGVAEAQTRNFTAALHTISNKTTVSHVREEPSQVPKSGGVGLFLKEARYRKIQFGGTSNESVNVFLRRVRELLEVVKLSEAERLRAIPDLFTDAAAQWYRVHRDEFYTWVAVEGALRRNYLPPNADTQLAVLLHTRTQDPNEKVLHYITQMRAINQDMATPLTESALIHLIRSHVHPKIARLIVFQDTSNYAELEKACLTAEHLIEQEREYQPPSLEVVSHPVYGDAEARDAKRKRTSVHAVDAKAVTPAQSSTKSEPSPSTSTKEAEAAPLKVAEVKKRPQQGTPAKKPPRNESDWQCKGCGLTGHYESNCPTTPRPFCFKCGETGKVMSECCRKSQSGNEKRS